jgi:hypothetical protein
VFAPGVSLHLTTKVATAERHGVTAHPKSARQPCGIQHLRLIVSQHLPISTERLGWNSGSESGHISLQIGLDESAPPFEAFFVIRRKETVRKATSHPELVARVWSDIRNLQLGERP